jgi:hypothetical protein
VEVAAFNVISQVSVGVLASATIYGVFLTERESRQHLSYCHSPHGHQPHVDVITFGLLFSGIERHSVEEPIILVAGRDFDFAIDWDLLVLLLILQR